VKVVVQDDADLWTSFQLNQLHGLPLTIEDRKRAALWLRQHHPQLSVREIARLVGIGVSTVQDVLSGRRGESGGRGLVQRPDPWRRFLQVLVQAYLRCENEQDFVNRLAEALVDLVEGQRDPGITWDALINFSAAVRLAWDATSELYSESGDEEAADG
jgi:hypothetical protein